MTVFKTFWKILSKNKLTVIIYTVILLTFGISNLSVNDNSMSFQAEKPNIFIVNNDKETQLTKGFIKYLNKNCNVKNIQNNKEVLNDALFYRELHYIVYIPEKYTEDFMDGKNPEIKVKSTGDYQSAYAEMIVTRYVQLANMYQKSINSEEELVNKVNEVLEEEVKIEMTSKLDATALQKATIYYNFASYSLIACLIFIIGLILNSFNEEKIKKRIIISSENYKKHNRILLFSNLCYSMIMWLFYVIISLILLKETMFTTRGLIYILNSFIFTISITAFSFLIGNLVNNREAMSGISNVVSLGSSFLCGAFVPVEWLPGVVVKIAHIFPTYYYITINERLKEIQEFSLKTISPLIANVVIMIAFTIVFIILSNIVAKQKRKIA